MFAKFTLLAAVLLSSCATTNDKQPPQAVFVTGSLDNMSALSPAYRDDKSALTDYSEKLVATPIEQAKSQLLLGATDEAERLAKSVLRADLSNIEARKIMAGVYLVRQQPTLSTMILENLRAQNDRDPEVLNLLAISAYQQKDYNLCFDFLQSSLQVKDDYLAARLNLASLYLEFSEYQAATIQLERILTLDPTNLDAQVHLANIKSMRGEWEPAEKLYQTALDANKNLPLARVNWAMFNKRQGQYEVAIETLEDAKEQPLTNLLSELKQEYSSLQTKTSDEEIKQLAKDLRSESDVDL